MTTHSTRAAAVLAVVTALAGGHAACAAPDPSGPDLPPPPAHGACTKEDPRPKAAILQMEPCGNEAVQSLIVSDLSPEAAADKALAACVRLRAQIRDLAVSCHGDPDQIEALMTAPARQALVTGVRAVRSSRANRDWLAVWNWHGGPCGADDKSFRAATAVYERCALDQVWKVGGDNSTLGDLAALAVAACADKQDLVARRIAQCRPTDAAGLATQYEMTVQEALLIAVMAVTAADDKQFLAMPAEFRDKDLNQYMYAYRACVAVESRLRVKAGAARETIRDDVLKVCAPARDDVVDYAHARLRPEQAQSWMEGVDEQVAQDAAQEVAAGGGR